MANKNITISVDEDVLKAFDRVIDKNERSPTISRLMENYATTRVLDVGGVDLQLLDLEINTLKKRKEKIDSQLSAKVEIRDKINEKQVEIEKKQLEIEKKALENAKRCMNCGNLLEEHNKIHKFPRGFVCHACFMGAKKEDWEQWK